MKTKLAQRQGKCGTFLEKNLFPIYAGKGSLKELVETKGAIHLDTNSEIFGLESSETVFSRNVHFENFGQPLEVFHVSEISEIPETFSGGRSIWEKNSQFSVRNQFKWNSNFRIVRFENFGQPLEVDHSFRNVGITGNFLFHLTDEI